MGGTTARTSSFPSRYAVRRALAERALWPCRNRGPRGESGVMNQIHTVEAAEQHTAVVHARVPMDELTRFFDRAFAATAAALHDQGLAPAGPPFGLYRGMPGATVDVEAGFPVATRIEPSGDVEAGTLPAGRTVEA